MKTLHINVDATTHRAAQNMAALLNMEPDRLLSHVVTKLAPILDKSDSEAAAALSVQGAIIARAKSEHARVKLTLPWGTWQQLSDYRNVAKQLRKNSQVTEENEKRKAAKSRLFLSLLAARLACFPLR